MEKLYELLKSCQFGGENSIVGDSGELGDFMERIYVPTKANDIIERFVQDNVNQDGKLLILVGSAGDGKTALVSHTLSSMRSCEGFISPRVNLDATTSRARDETYDQALSDFLQSIKKDIVERNGNRSILAINLGLSIDFFERNRFKEEHVELWRLLSEAKCSDHIDENNIEILNMGMIPLYGTTYTSLGDGFLKELVDKFDFSNRDSPFNQAYEMEQESCSIHDCILYYNCKMFTDSKLRDYVCRYIAGQSIINSQYINPRWILDYISGIILPKSLSPNKSNDCECPMHGHNPKDNMDKVIWNLIFTNNRKRFKNPFDPVPASSRTIENDLFSILRRPGEHISELGFDTDRKTMRFSFLDLSRAIVRKRHILDDQYFDEFHQLTEPLRHYFNMYTYFKGYSEYDETYLDDSYEFVRRNILNGLESVSTNLRGDDSTMIRITESFDDPEYEMYSWLDEIDIDDEITIKETRMSITPGLINIHLSLGRTSFTLPIDFQTFDVLYRSSQGYNVSSIDIRKSQGIQILSRRMSNFTKKKEKVRLARPSDGSKVTIEKSLRSIRPRWDS